MKLHFFIIACILVCAPFFLYAAQPGDVVISEIAYDLKGADDGHEWVELHNVSANDIDLTGWKFSDGANHVLNVPPKNGGQGKIIISAGGYAILADDAAVFLTDHPNFSGTVIDTVMSLNNTGATLMLVDNNGVAIDTVAYQKDAGAAGNGMTLERDGAGSWKESALEGGTPGAANGTASASHNQQQTGGDTATTTPSTAGTQASSVFASHIIADAGENVAALTGDEIVFDASGTQGGGGAAFVWNFGDGTIASGEKITHRYMFPGKYIVVLSVSGAEDTIEANIYPHGVVISEFMPDGGMGEAEWIELHNDSSYSADLSEWGLGTNDTKPSFIMPQGTMLAAGGYLVLARDVSHIALPNEKGTIALWYPHGQPAMHVEYDHAKKSFSAARKTDGSYVWTDQRTPGARNVFIVSEARAAGAPRAAAVNERDTHAPSLRAAWHRVRDDAGGSIRSFIAEPAHAMVYDEGASAAVPRTPVQADAYGAFPFGMAALLGGIAGVALGIVHMRRRAGR